MEQRKRTIGSIEELQKVVPLIVKAINDDPQLGLRASANPLLAVEELGYEIPPKVQHEAERRIRFTKETAARLDNLEGEIYRRAGRRFEINNPHELGEILFDKLKLQPPETGQESFQVREPLSRVDVEPLPPRVVGHGSIPDPLEVLRGAHPVIVPLLEFRQLEASAARLASRDYYERIKRGEVKMPVVRVQARLKRSRTPK